MEWLTIFVVVVIIVTAVALWRRGFRIARSNTMKLESDDYESLKGAVNVLENPGLAIQIANFIGKPIESGVQKLPDSVSERIGEATRSALRLSLRVAVSTMNNQRGLDPSTTTHKILATLSGTAGGAFGLPALAIELPVSTTIMLRSIADIARGEGENLCFIETQVACIEVFALGGRSQSDDGSETGYYATRVGLYRAVADAAKHIAEKGLAEEGAPAIVRLIAKIATRFSIPVTDKFLAQSLPTIGAVGGATINLIFINHFQDMARGHFTVRRLERKYGAELIQSEYERIHREA